MAETIEKNYTHLQDAYSSTYDLKTRKDKKFIVFGGRIAVDAAPSDTTLYTVPKGKVFYLIRYYGGRQNAATPLTFCDASGDSSVLSTDARVTFINSNYTYNNTEVTLVEPIPFYKGITFDSTELNANINVDFLIQGYLVG